MSRAAEILEKLAADYRRIAATPEQFLSTADELREKAEALEAGAAVLRQGVPLTPVPSDEFNRGLAGGIDYGAETDTWEARGWPAPAETPQAWQFTREDYGRRASTLEWFARTVDDAGGLQQTAAMLREAAKHAPSSQAAETPREEK